jgi:hypothetical protein
MALPPFIKSLPAFLSWPAPPTVLARALKELKPKLAAILANIYLLSYG